MGVREGWKKGGKEGPMEGVREGVRGEGGVEWWGRAGGRDRGRE